MGDFVDRGFYSVETFLLLLALKVSHYRLQFIYSTCSGGATGGGGGGGGGAVGPPMIVSIFFKLFFLPVSSAVIHGHDDNTPTPLWEFVGILFCPQNDVSESPPPPPPRWATFSALAQNFGLAQQERDILPPPPKQTPWRRPCLHVIHWTYLKCRFKM